jgi:hypothetical protein
MLGWNISVYRLECVDLAFPSLISRDAAQEQPLREAASSLAARIAVWQTGLGGLEWIRDLVSNGQAIELPGAGYPNRYFAPAKLLLPPILQGPPSANAGWIAGPHEILTPEWEGRTTIDRAAAAGCNPDEWLLVEAWDES